MTVTMFALAGQPDKDKDMMNILMGDLFKRYDKGGKILNSSFYRNSSGEPAAYIEYTIGEGMLQEHNAGVFMRTGKAAAAFIQVQARKRKFDPADGEKLQSLLGKKQKTVKDKPAAKPPAAEKKSDKKK